MVYLHKRGDGLGIELETYCGTEDFIMWYFEQYVTVQGKINVGYFNSSSPPSNSMLYLRAINSMGMCLFCGELDWRVLQEHHPDKIKLPNFKVTLCANCHAKLHWNYGTHITNRRGKSRKC